MAVANNIGSQPAGGWKPSQKQKDDAGRAADKIESFIDSEGVFSIADQSEVAEAGSVLSRLDSVTADATIDALASRGLLDDFAAEIVDGSWLGPGLRADDRMALFANLAKQLDAKSLIALYDAFLDAGTAQAGKGYAQEIADAIKTHTSPAARLEFVELLATRAKSRWNNLACLKMFLRRQYNQHYIPVRTATVMLRTIPLVLI